MVGMTLPTVAPIPSAHRHDCDVLMDKGQAGGILDLLARGVLDRYAARPRLDR